MLRSLLRRRTGNNVTGASSRTYPNITDSTDNPLRMLVTCFLHLSLRKQFVGCNTDISLEGSARLLDFQPSLILFITYVQNM